MNIYRLWGVMEEYMDSLLEWPTPPYFKDATVGAADQAETCVLYLRDGRKILGDLLQFSPQAAQLVFLPTRDEASETIALDRIKSVRLVRSLMLKPQSIALEKRTEEIHPPSHPRRRRREREGQGAGWRAGSVRRSLAASAQALAAAVACVNSTSGLPVISAGCGRPIIFSRVGARSDRAPVSASVAGRPM